MLHINGTVVVFAPSFLVGCMLLLLTGTVPAVSVSTVGEGLVSSGIDALERKQKHWIPHGRNKR